MSCPICSKLKSPENTGLKETTDLEVNAGKASKDLEEGEHVLLAGEELEVGLLVHVPVLSAPT